MQDIKHLTLWPCRHCDHVLVAIGLTKDGVAANCEKCHRVLVMKKEYQLMEAIEIEEEVGSVEGPFNLSRVL